MSLKYQRDFSAFREGGHGGRNSSICGNGSMQGSGNREGRVKLEVVITFTGLC